MNTVEYIMFAQKNLQFAKSEIERLHNYMEPKNKNASLDHVEILIDGANVACTKALLKNMEETYG